MINLEFQTYNYFQYGEKNAHGQQTLSNKPTGAVKMAIYPTTQTIQGNIKYKDATFMGLTYALLDDSCVIQYGEAKLKVLYINPKGRLKQVFMAEI